MGQRVLVTGGTGVLGRATAPLLWAEGYQVDLPVRAELDLFDADQVAAAVRNVDAVLHLASRIPPPDEMGAPRAWEDNDRLRDQATRLLIDAALAAATKAVVVPTVAFTYPPGPANESTPLAEVPSFLRSTLRAEEHLRYLTSRGRRGVALRLGALYGPYAATPIPTDRYTVHLHTFDAATALVAALSAPGGVYNVVDDAGTVSHARFTQSTGWVPGHGGLND